MVHQLTRGYKKKARTRQALVDAAIRIYTKKNVGELLLNELAEEADVSNGTVYNYFTKREEVLAAAGIELANQLSHRITSVSQDIESGSERVAVGVRMFILQGRENPNWSRAVVRVYQYDKHIRSIVAKNLRGDLELGKRQGLFCYKNEEIAMALVASVTMGAIIAILDGLDHPEYDVTIAEMVLLSLGVTPEKANLIANLKLPEPKQDVSQTEPMKRKRGRPRKIIE